MLANESEIIIIQKLISFCSILSILSTFFMVYLDVQNKFSVVNKAWHQASKLTGDFCLELNKLIDNDSDKNEISSAILNYQNEVNKISDKTET